MPRDDNDNLSLDDLQNARQIKNLADEPGMSDLFGKETGPEAGRGRHHPGVQYLYLWGKRYHDDRRYRDKARKI